MATPVIWFDASFGGVELLIAELDTETGRDVAVKSPARGNQHTLYDRGAKLLRANATILFIDQPGKDAFTSRFDDFRALFMRDDNADIFSHPLLGSYRARIADVNVRLSADAEQIEVQCTVLAEDEPQTVFRPGAGVSSDAGVEAVTVAGATAEIEMDALDLRPPTPVTTDALAAATMWSTTDPDELDTNAVTSALATITGQIATAIAALNLTTDLERWPAYRALINLAYQLRRAAEAATSSAENLIDVTLTVEQPLRPVCARIYGPALSDERSRQVAKLNRIRTPGRVPRGTYKFPADGASP